MTGHTCPWLQFPRYCSATSWFCYRVVWLLSLRIAHRQDAVRRCAPSNPARHLRHHGNYHAHFLRRRRCMPLKLCGALPLRP
jgi:hypothetical protein